MFAITTDTFIVLTSNACAILDLRSLRFLLAGLIVKFTHLKVGLGAIQVLAGAKMLLSDVIEVPPLLSPTLIVGLLLLAIGASVVVNRRRWTTLPEVRADRPPQATGRAAERRISSIRRLRSGPPD